MRIIQRLRWVALAALAVALLSIGTPAKVAHGGDKSNPGVLPVNSKPYGASYAEWSARHWQWLFSLPASTHPLFGDDNDASQGQQGKVWFLGGTFATIEIEPGVIAGIANRSVTIPAGKALFFPLVDSECSTLEGNGETEAELRACAEFFTDFTVLDSLFCVIDGKDVKNLADFGVESSLFTWGPLPADNIFGNPDAFPEGATSPAVSDGYFVMLHPLSAGTHTIHFGGALDLTEIGGPVFLQDITYTITVK